MRYSPLRRALLPLAALGAAACATADGPGARIAVRDSAGVEIVENAGGGLWKAGEGLRLSARPVLEIGGIEGEEGSDLYLVRGAVRLGDGRIVVADGASAQLRFYSAGGRHLAAAGRSGDGPGEFRDLAAVGRAEGDTVLAYDPRAGRISVFTPAGAYVRSAAVGEPGLLAAEAPVGWLASHVFVTQKSRVDEGVGPPADSGGRIHYRARASLQFHGPDGRLLRTVAGLAGNEGVTFMSAAGAGRFRLSTVPVPFLKTLQTSAGRRSVAVGSTDAYEIRLYGDGGQLRRIVRGPAQDRAVTRAHVDAWLRESLADVRDPAVRRERRRQYEALPLPAELPAFAGLLLDGADRLWVREYDPPGRATAAERWSVFDPRGRRLGEVEMPVRFVPCQIGADFVLGIRKDTLDVERVEMYRLTH
ncbi:MAG TPA: hypothetical protein VF092_24150 [Longimicrobium sp.]